MRKVTPAEAQAMHHRILRAIAQVVDPERVDGAIVFVRWSDKAVTAATLGKGSSPDNIGEAPTYILEHLPEIAQDILAGRHNLPDEAADA